MRMRWWLGAGLALAAAGAAGAPTEMTLSVEARSSALMPGSSEGATKRVAIPSTCAYVSHHVDVLEREPPVQGAGAPGATTSYSTDLQRASDGRITSVALTVLARVTPELLPAAIGARLTVRVRCERAGSDRDAPQEPTRAGPSGDPPPR
ncbi:MAG: hypothetical protein JSR54_12415 [Proteobacteria bacterium]|nr:hypothetical protein [Pseudomonadota bacterium]